MRTIINTAVYLPAHSRVQDSNVLPIFSCFNANIGGVLKACGYGDDVDFMLNRQFHFYYWSSGKKIYFNCDLFSFFEDFREFDKIEIVRTHYPSWRECQVAVNEEILAGVPVIATVDQYFVPFHKYYSKEHVTHSLLVIGVDDDSFYVTDIGGVKRLSFGEFESSLHSTHFELITLVLPSERREYGSEVIRSLIARNVEFGLNFGELNFADGKYPTNNTGLEGANVFPGVHGIRKLANDLVRSFGERTEVESEKLLSFYSDRSYEIVIQRFSHIAFLESARKCLRGKELLIGEIIGDIHVLVHDWKVVKNLFHKARIKDRTDILQRISKRLSVIADKENLVFLKMKMLVDL